MIKREPLSPLEWVTYRALAFDPRPGGTSVEAVRSELHATAGKTLAISTVNTVLIRLREKGWIRTEYEDRKAYHFPSVPYPEALQLLARNFVEQYHLDEERDLELVRAALAPTS